MIVSPRNRIPALALAIAIIGAASVAFAQPPSIDPADQDHSAHHPSAETPGGAAPGAGSPGARTAMPMHMMGRGMMMNGDMEEMMSMMRGMMTMMSAQSGMMSAHVEGRIAFLKTELKITDTQTPQWDRFADALRAAARSMNEMFGQMMQPGSTGTLTARLGRQETMLSAHLAAVKALKEALEPLYGSFNDEQKNVADRLMIGPMGMM
jgi:hypothetical protein